MKCKIFLSAMGWGHMVRSLAVLKELINIYPKLKITIQTEKKNIFFKKFLKKKIKYIYDDNLIKYYFNQKGEIDINKTKKKIKNYQIKSKKWFEKNLKDKDYNFFISDISPEAIYLGNVLKIPVFGLCHFTWDWFSSKIKNSPVNSELIKKWIEYQKKASLFFFPPLTPKKILNTYKNHYKIPFIYLKEKKRKIKMNTEKKKILLLDSGDSIYKKMFKNLIKKEQNDRNFLIMHSEKIGKFENTYQIKKSELITDYIIYADYIIARPGFNTLTSVIKYNKYATFITDKFNPELKWNILSVKKNKNFRNCTITKINKEFSFIKKKLLKKKKFNKKNVFKKYHFDGQKIIANKISEFIK